MSDLVLNFATGFISRILELMKQHYLEPQTPVLVVKLSVDLVNLTKNLYIKRGKFELPNNLSGCIYAERNLLLQIAGTHLLFIDD